MKLELSTSLARKLALHCFVWILTPWALAAGVPPHEEPCSGDLKSLQLTPVLIDEVLVAHNRGWAARLDGQGLVVTPDAGGWTWGLTLVSYGFAEAENFVAQPERVRVAGMRITYEWNPMLSEWYVNDTQGLEHGYTLRQRPVQSAQAGPLMFQLATLGNLTPEVTADGRGVHFVDQAGSPQLTYLGLLVFDALGRDLPAYFESTSQGLTLAIDERDAVYPLTIDPVVQGAYLKASNAEAGDRFGSSVAIDGDTAVIGTTYEESQAVGVDGDESDNSLTKAGAAYVFVRGTSGWSQQAYLKASNTETFDQFGFAVAIFGDTLAVSAYTESSSAKGVGGDETDNGAGGSGAVYVFHRTGTTWSQEAYIKASNTEAGDAFGSSLALSGDSLVVGAFSEDSGATGVNGNELDNSAKDSGAAYVFVRSAGVWSQQAYLKASDVDADDTFGTSVAIDQDLIVVGAPREDSAATGVDGNDANESAQAAGAAYVFRRTGTTWVQAAYLKASNTEALDFFGTATGVSGDTVVVGAPFEDSSAAGIGGNQNDNSMSTSGAAYVFVRSSGMWAQDAYVKASNPGAGHHFGDSLAIFGDKLLVGAEQEASSAAGPNGKQDDTSKFGSGAAYVFSRAAGPWEQTAILKASNTDAWDRFGKHVAIHGDAVLVSAPEEDSSATGVNGNQGDNSSATSGAAYAFDLAATTGASRYGLYAQANVADLFSTSSAAPGAVFTLDFTDFTHPGVAFLMISAAPAQLTPFPGGTLLVDPSQAILGAGGLITVPITQIVGPAYTGHLQVPIKPSMIGLSYYCQAAQQDAAKHSGWLLTNGLAVTIAP